MKTFTIIQPQQNLIRYDGRRNSKMFGNFDETKIMLTFDVVLMYIPK